MPLLMFQGRIRVRILIVIILSFPIFVLLTLHLREELMINHFLKEYKLSNLPLSKKSAFIVSDTLNKLFNTSHWIETDNNLNKMPYFRTPVSRLLKTREGVCGEGARVLVRLLRELDFDATRVAIFTKNFGARGHALVSVIINGKEYFIDSLNGGSEMHELLRSHDINTGLIKIIPYYRRYEREFQNISYNTDSAVYAFQQHYIAYSYEALPLSKILNTFGINCYVLNLKRPLGLISYLAESVFLIYLIMYIVMLVLLVPIVNYSYLLYKSKIKKRFAK